VVLPLIVVFIGELQLESSTTGRVDLLKKWKIH